MMWNGSPAPASWGQSRLLQVREAVFQKGRLLLRPNAFAPANARAPADALSRCYAECKPSYFGEDQGLTSVRSALPVRVATEHRQFQLQKGCNKQESRRIALLTSF